MFNSFRASRVVARRIGNSIHISADRKTKRGTITLATANFESLDGMMSDRKKLVDTLAKSAGVPTEKRSSGKRGNNDS